MLNFGKILNKKVVIIFIVVLIPLVGAIIYGNWKIYQDEKRISEMPAGEFFGFNLGILPEGFNLEETAIRKTLKSEDLGISFWVDSNWEILGYLDNYIDLRDPDYEYDTETFTHIKGCQITIEVRRFVLPGTLHSRVKGVREGVIQLNENEDILEINGQDALKITESDEWLSRKGIEKTIEIRIPLSKVDMYFSTAVFQEDGVKCEVEFNKFLETVLIQ